MWPHWPTLVHLSRLWFCSIGGLSGPSWWSGLQWGQREPPTWWFLVSRETQPSSTGTRPTPWSLLWLQHPSSFSSLSLTVKYLQSMFHPTDLFLSSPAGMWHPCNLWTNSYFKDWLPMIWEDVTFSVRIMWKPNSASPSILSVSEKINFSRTVFIFWNQK